MSSKDVDRAEFADELKKARVDAQGLHATVLEALRLAQRHGLGKEQSLRETAKLVQQVVKRIDGVLPADRASCFPYETKIAVPRGMRELGQMEVGDSVLSWDPEAQACTVERVTRVLRHDSVPLWEVHAEEHARILATRGHTLLTRRGWVRVDCLRVGDEMVLADCHGLSRFVPLRMVGPNDRTAPVASLHTTRAHNFIADGFVAHNFTHLRRLRVALHRLLLDRSTGRACALPNPQVSSTDRRQSVAPRGKPPSVRVTGDNVKQREGL